MVAFIELNKPQQRKLGEKPLSDKTKAMSSAPLKRAYGRSLRDFRIAEKGTLHGLLPAEEKLLDATARGESYTIGHALPDDENEDNQVRGTFLRFLLLGGDGEAPVHEKGIQLFGALVQGDIDLGNAVAVVPLRLRFCRIAGKFLGHNARLGPLNLSGSQIQGITCDGAKITGDVFLREGFTAEGEVRFLGTEIGGQLSCRNGEFKNADGSALNFDGAKITDSVFLSDDFTAEGEVRFPGAEIGGQLNCRKGKFKNAGGFALNCDGAKITGNVLLDDDFSAEGEVRFPGAEIGGQLNCGNGKFKNSGGFALSCDRAKITGHVFLVDDFTAEGEVRFLGAEIGGQLSCRKGTFKNAGGFALICDNAKITGNVFLNNDFTAEGEVRFLGAEIGGDLVCRGGSFQNLKQAPTTGNGDPPEAGDALTLQSARISGVLFLGPAQAPNDQHAKFDGSIDLQNAYVKVLVDDPKSWPSATVKTDAKELRCVLKLDGFVYERFSGGSLTDAATRRAWLLRQPHRHLNADFRPQPFEQLIKVLREMGHAREARAIGYFKEQCRLRLAWRNWSKRLNPIEAIRLTLKWLFIEKALGYGYYPQRMVVAASVVWLACGIFYQAAVQENLFAPTNARVYLDEKIRKTCVNNGKPAWTSSQCALAQRVPEYPVFNPYIFSLDVILPIISLGQEESWQPMYNPFHYSIGGYAGDLSPNLVRGVVWAEAIFAWVWSLSLSAVATGVIKRD